MTRLLLHFAAAASLLLGAGATRAQSEEIIVATLGRYTVLPVDGSPGCDVELRREKTIGGRVATPAPECAARIRALGAVAGWYLSGSVVLIDATRRVVMKFEEDETTIAASPSVAEPKYYLVAAVPGVTHLPQPAELVGTWQLAKGKSAPCKVTFALDGRKPGDAGTLRLEPGCRLGGDVPKLRRWRMEAVTLLLESDDDAVVFWQAGAASFAAGTGGLRLSR